MKTQMAAAFAAAEEAAGTPAVAVADQFVPVPGDRYQELRDILAGAPDEEIRFDQAAHLIAQSIEGARGEGKVGLAHLREVAAIVAAAIPEQMVHNSATLVDEWTAVNTMVLELETEKTELTKSLRASEAKANALEAQQSIMAAKIHKGVNASTIETIRQQARHQDDRKGKHIALVLETNGMLTRVTL